MSLVPAIDYTNKDYASLRQAMLDLARYRLPEWTDQSPADLGMLLVDLFAYMGDIVLYYQDRIASESFLATATERRSVLHLLRLIGYELQPPVAASASLTLTFKPPATGDSTPVTVPQGAQFTTLANGGGPQTFEYLGPDLQINLDPSAGQVTATAAGKLVYGGLPVRHSRSVPAEIIGSSTGEPNQSFSLAQSPLIVESLQVQVDEGAGWIPWNRRDNLLYFTDDSGYVTLSDAQSRDYYVQFDENGVAWVVFGDGVYGLRPPVGTNNIQAAYRVGGGAIGNVPAGSITSARTTIRLLDSVTNPAPAAGGSDSESIDHAVSFGPLAFRSGERAVTLNDFVALAQQAGGVAKVRAHSRGWNQIDLYVAPEGDTCTAAPPDLKTRLIAYFEDKRMVGTFVNILDPTCVPIDINLAVVPQHHYDPAVVQQAVVAAVTGLLAFKNVDFGQPLYLSKVYEAVDAVPGVYASTVSLFRRHDSPARIFEEGLGRFGVPGLPELPVYLVQAMRVDITSLGRIDIGDFEIAVLGNLDVTMTETTQ